MHAREALMEHTARFHCPGAKPSARASSAGGLIVEGVRPATTDPLLPARVVRALTGPVRRWVLASVFGLAIASASVASYYAWLQDTVRASIPSPPAIDVYA